MKWQINVKSKIMSNFIRFVFQTAIFPTKTLMREDGRFPTLFITRMVVCARKGWEMIESLCDCDAEAHYSLHISLFVHSKMAVKKRQYI